MSKHTNETAQRIVEQHADITAELCVGEFEPDPVLLKRIEDLERRQADAERRLLEISDYLSRKYGLLIGGVA